VSEPERNAAGGSRPVPDPTVLTTQALYREVNALKELLLTELSCLKREVAQRFVAVEQQRVEQKRDTKDAVDSALSAQREAITKSETSTKEQLGQLTVNFATGIKAVTDGLNDLKERVGKIESLKQGAVESRESAYAGISNVTGILGAVIAVVVVVIALYATRSKPVTPVVVTPTPVTTTTATP
jgi:hypothetical protein